MCSLYVCTCPQLSGVSASLSATTAADLPDLLRLACKRNEGLADLLLDHDRDHMHLLHSGAASSEDSPSAPTAGTHQQQQKLPERTQQLLWELLEESVKRQHNRVLQRLCDVPAAQKLSECFVSASKQRRQLEAALES